MTSSEQALFDELIHTIQTRSVADSLVRFWLRDDDAIYPSEPLEQLLNLCEQYAVPLSLAVIPKDTGVELSERLARHPSVAVTLHGWSHTNYAPEGEKSQELGDHRCIEDTLAELHRGIERLSTLHQHRYEPVLVPPWNRISDSVLSRVHELGIEAVSVFGQEMVDQHEGLRVRLINTQVDVIDWRGTRGGRSTINLIEEILLQLRQGRSTIGVLSHHLVHDSAAWAFLEKLFIATTAETRCRWVSIADLISDRLES